MKYILLLSSVIVSIYCSAANSDSLLIVLEKTIMQRNEYDIKKEKKINAYKLLLNEGSLSLENKYEINQKLITEYQFYNLDSTIKYLKKNIIIGKKLNNDILVLEAKLNISQILINSGRIPEALHTIENIHVNVTDSTVLKKYYRTYYDIYSKLSEQSLIKNNSVFFKKQIQNYHDSLLNVLTKNTLPFIEFREIYNFKNENYKTSLDYNTKRINRTKENSIYYSIATYYRAAIYQKLHNPDSAKLYYIKTAIYDIKLSKKNNAALADLALMLYNEKKYDLAKKYINIAMDDARFFNSKHRFLSLSKVLPVINEAYQNEIENQKKNMKFYTKISTFFAILFLIAIIITYIQYKRLGRARNELRFMNSELKHLNIKLNDSNEDLKVSNIIKEQYIGSFLEYCSAYIDKLDNYRKMVNKEISGRRVAELFETTKSKRMVQLELKEFYHNFDKTFLDIYPDFTNKVNDLIKPEEQITLKKGELLNTELRILALIRLGITDSSNIARLLRYSVNTIYNYRAQIKNKAKGDKELFEQQVNSIGTWKNN